VFNSNALYSLNRHGVFTIPLAPNTPWRAKRRPQFGAAHPLFELF
jgi:hypothetical protein